MSTRTIVVVLLALFGCSQASSTTNGTFSATPFETVESQSGMLEATVFSTTGGLTRGANTLEIHVTDRNGHPIDGLSLSATPWMPSHAHGTSSSPIVDAIGGGDYVVREINLFMPGQWQLRVSVAGATPDALTPVLDVP